MRLTLPAHQQVAHQHLPVLDRAVRRWQVRLAACKRCDPGITTTTSISTPCHVVSDHTMSMAAAWPSGRVLLFSCKYTVGAGPFPLDLGDSLYAPNCFKDGLGRRLMLGWFQELGARGPSSESTYSGCLTLPRVLSRRGAGLVSCWPTVRLCHMLLLSELASKLIRCMTSCSACAVVMHKRLTNAVLHCRRQAAPGPCA